jgi:quinol-cytochrome oxidoreductase complex cytochrome b subunit
MYLVVYAVVVFYAPDILGNPDNYTPANPLVTPPDIVPDWYLLPFYAMLRSIPQKLIGVVVLFGALLTLVFIPWLDTSRVRSSRFRPVFKWLFWIFFFDTILLGYLGSQSVDATFPYLGLPDVWLARFATGYYYVFFWVLMPLVGLFETPKPLPATIATAVLSKTAAE